MKHGAMGERTVRQSAGPAETRNGDCRTGSPSSGAALADRDAGQHRGTREGIHPGGRGSATAAIQLLLSYGYGPPRAEIEAGERLLIEVVYVERNSIAIASPIPSASTGDSESGALQPSLLR